jgi:6-phosphofructokinase 1
MVGVFSQIALCSIQGLMCGFTNFAIGHFKNRVAMVPLDQMTHGDKYCLKVEDENWQRLLTTTNQPTFSSSLR